MVSRYEKKKQEIDESIGEHDWTGRWGTLQAARDTSVLTVGWVGRQVLVVYSSVLRTQYYIVLLTEVVAETDHTS